MPKIRSILMLLTVSLIATIISSCEKPPGPGGKAVIKGKVWAVDYDNTFYRPITEGYAVDERVYIIYGNGTTPNDDVRTGPDGSFEFRFLNKGHYRVYVNSLDTAGKGYKGLDSYKSIIKDVDLGASETKTLDDFKMSR
jgi:hypothetical protein